MSSDLKLKIKSSFLSEFKTEPLLVFSPGRINLIGEHTDYNKGLVFPAAVDKGIVVGIQKSELNISSIIAVDEDERYDFSLNTIKPIKNSDWKNYILGVISEIQKAGKQIENFNLVFGGNIPKGAGISSSAALENSIAYAINELFNLGLTKKELIYISQKAEHNYVGVKCGIMDQYASMFGRKDKAILLDCESLEAKQVTLNLNGHSLLLVNSNVKHSLAESAYNDRRNTCEKVAIKLKVQSLRQATLPNLSTIKDVLTDDEYQKALYVFQENKRVLNAYEAILQNDLLKLGDLLYNSHNGLKNQNKVSCKELDFLVEKAKKSNAVIGARMMGGGFGGCTINIVKNHLLDNFKKDITKLYSQKFNIKCSFYTVKLSQGTRLLSIK
jgi:galactokinase